MQFNYFDDWKTVILECEKCHWKGTFEEGIVENYNDLMDCTCPSCDYIDATILAIVSYPTNEECKNNFEKLSEIDKTNFIGRTNRFERWKNECLKPSSKLPDIFDKKIILSWDFEEFNSDVYNIIRYKNQELWRELAFYEGFERFIEILSILKQKYGDRLIDVVPTDNSNLYLLGDRISAIGIVKDARKELNTLTKN